MYILTAAQSDQAALEAAELGHGYLTYTLVEEGLKTSAAELTPQDGKVDIREWLDYATVRVPQMQIEKMYLTRNLALSKGRRKLPKSREGASSGRRLILPGSTCKKDLCPHFPFPASPCILAFLIKA